MVRRRECVAAATAIALECVERRAEWPRGRVRADQALTPWPSWSRASGSGFHNLLTGQIAHHAQSLDSPAVAGDCILSRPYLGFPFFGCLAGLWMREKGDRHLNREHRLVTARASAL
jgi:hypothetical protein